MKKGLFKGLKYISQIFDNYDGKEPEMEIGLPTDVKHVAHIGWDGPSANTPSWMNEYKGPELSTEPFNPKPPKEEAAGSGNEKQKHKSRRKPSPATESPISPSKTNSSGGVDGTKQSRRHCSAQTSDPACGFESPSNTEQTFMPKNLHLTSIDSPSKEPARRNQGTSNPESPSRREQPLIPKNSRPKKTKVPAGGDSTIKSSRCKDKSSCLTSKGAGNCPFTDLESSNDDYVQKA